MERLTNEEVRVDESMDRYLGPLSVLEGMKPKLLDLILNGPVLNGVSKDVLHPRGGGSGIGGDEEMSKAVMLSIRPKWCEKIVNGDKTIEVRKTRPKLETPFKCYVYRTKGTVPHIINGKWVQMEVGGTIIAEFTCDRIYELAPLNHAPDDVEKQACLTREEIVNYLKGTGYGWHISDLSIYDPLRELTEFRRSCPNDLFCESCAMYSNNNGICNNGALPLRRPPQSWCYVEEG